MLKIWQNGEKVPELPFVPLTDSDIKRVVNWAAKHRPEIVKAAMKF